jgi:hypothetical protein
MHMHMASGRTRTVHPSDCRCFLELERSPKKSPTANRGRKRASLLRRPQPPQKPTWLYSTVWKHNCCRNTHSAAVGYVPPQKHALDQDLLHLAAGHFSPLCADTWSAQFPASRAGPMSAQTPPSCSGAMPAQRPASCAGPVLTS